MGATSTKDLRILITTADAVGESLIPTAITSAKPAVITVTNTLADGDVVFCINTGFPELDGKYFMVASASGTEFTLLGSDTAGSTGALAVSPTVSAYDQTEDMVSLCLATITLNVDEPGTVSVATFCDPSATIASAVSQAGTLSFTGFVDILDEDYQELLLAENDGVERVMTIELPSNGYLVAPMTFTSISWDLPVDGATGYSGTAVLATKMVHQF